MIVFPMRPRCLAENNEVHSDVSAREHDNSARARGISRLDNVTWQWLAAKTRCARKTACPGAFALIHLISFAAQSFFCLVIQ